MLRRPYPPAPGLRLCQACELVSGQQWSAQRPLGALRFGKPSAVPTNLAWSVSVRSFTTSPALLKVKRSQSSQSSQSPEPSQSRFGKTGAAATYQPPGLDPAAVGASVDRVLSAFMGPIGIPSE